MPTKKHKGPWARVGHRWIQRIVEFALELGLTDVENDIVMSVLYFACHTTSKELWVRGSKVKWAKYFGRSPNGVYKAIDRLVEKGLIERKKKGSMLLRPTNKLLRVADKYMKFPWSGAVHAVK